jgi:hypothetical protein
MNQICIRQHGTLAELLRNRLRRRVVPSAGRADELCLPLAVRDNLSNLEERQ